MPPRPTDARPRRRPAFAGAVLGALAMAAAASWTGGMTSASGATFPHLPPAAPAPGLAAVSPAAVVQPMADFQLRDVNPNSPRFNTAVSPRDYRLQISAYYFGAAG